MSYIPIFLSSDNNYAPYILAFVITQNHFAISIFLMVVLVKKISLV